MQWLSGGGDSSKKDPGIVTVSSRAAASPAAPDPTAAAAADPLLAHLRALRALVPEVDSRVGKGDPLSVWRDIESAKALGADTKELGEALAALLGAYRTWHSEAGGGGGCQSQTGPPFSLRSHGCWQCPFSPNPWPCAAPAGVRFRPPGAPQPVAEAEGGPGRPGSPRRHPARPRAHTASPSPPPPRPRVRTKLCIPAPPPAPPLAAHAHGDGESGVYTPLHRPGRGQSRQGAARRAAAAAAAARAQRCGLRGRALRCRRARHRATGGGLAPGGRTPRQRGSAPVARQASSLLSGPIPPIKAPVKLRRPAAPVSDFPALIAGALSAAAALPELLAEVSGQTAALQARCDALAAAVDKL